ncbi:MAG TPA: family 43 glycosylhydrolase [Prolixibacteraceae bacterium]|nr:family 43 glycosylhydrolase [Prolixibacteraceae bacterium]
MRTFVTMLILVALSQVISAQNPIVTDQFSADPSARVFNGKVYVFPSHDIPTPPEKPGRKDWFCMEDYHVYSSENLTEWTDHGMIISQYSAPWVDSTTYSMWAPDCIERNGKYYFYFPANKKATGSNGRGGFAVGVAIADRPEGPYRPEKEPIKGIFGIDPNVLIDKDGQAYIYWSMGNIYVAKLKENMLELDSEPIVIQNLPQKGMKEGPWVFERNGTYYMTFPHVENTIERLEYATGKSPLGPFTMTGVIMDESPTSCWTNHHSIVEYNKQWYLFYHHNDLSPKFDKNRSIRVDSLFFNADGTIQKVIPTLRAVGIAKAEKEIQIDRYSALSEVGAKIEFIDSTNTKLGWKTELSKKDAWVRFNKVELKNNYKSLIAKAKSEQNGMLEIRANSLNGPVLAKLNINKTSDWKDISAKLEKYKAGIQDLFVISKSENPVEVDWIKFE